MYLLEQKPLYVQMNMIMYREPVGAYRQCMFFYLDSYI